MAPVNSLQKKERLKSKKVSEELFAGKRSISVYPFKAVYSLMPELPADGIAQVMFVSPKRNLKKAHDRNRIKRLMRESYRRHKHPLLLFLTSNNKKLALALIYLTNNSLLTLEESDKKITQLLEQVILKCS
jgi:ribonuclease P protein component